MRFSLAFIAKHVRSPLAGSCTRMAGRMLAAAAICGVAVGQIPDPSETDRIDSRFLAELNRRQLFDLSADFARVRIRQHRDPEIQAFWTDQLAQVYLKRMWEESRMNRQALMQQSVELITEFLDDHSVRPETALAMRLTQIETLLNLARVNLLLNTVGHRGPERQLPEVASDGVLPLIDQAEELVDALLRQLQQNRGSLIRREAGMLRERGNQLSAELAVTRWLANGSDDSSGHRIPERYQELRTRVRAFSRAARNQETRQVAALLLAELQVAAGDGDAVLLILRNQSSLLNETQRLSLRLRLLLRQDKATEALEESYSAANTVTGAPSELTVLRLEALLLLRMQADDLQDTALKTQSDSAFLEQSRSVPDWPASVWKDAAIRVLQRYELVKTVGAEVAALVEQVQLLNAAGQQAEAIRILRRSLRLLPADATAQSQAAIRLRLGEIFVSQQQWDEARPLLQRSVELFVDAEQPAAASTAALLDVYCTGQQWRLAPQDQTLRDVYFQGLSEHRERWNGETAAQESTGWLIQLTRQVDPLLAAEIMAEQAAQAEARPERLKQLILLGEQLERARAADVETRSTRSWSELVKELNDHSDQHQLIAGELTPASARLLLLRTSLSTDATTELAVWGRLQKRLTDVEAAIIDADLTTRRRLSLLQLVAEVRSSTDTQRAAQRLTKYSVDVRDDPSQAAQQLVRYLNSSGRVQPGDLAIAGALEQLIAVQIPAAVTATELSDLLMLATLANRVTRNEEYRQILISRLLTLDLDSDQTIQIASALMSTESQLRGQAAGELRTLWQRIHEDSQQGSELWLESCLQLAQIHAAAGQAAEAARQLEVTSVIYPDWGSVDRKRRVQEFLRRTRSAEESE